jgi:hypothetical protein
MPSCGIEALRTVRCDYPRVGVSGVGDWPGGLRAVRAEGYVVVTSVAKPWTRAEIDSLVRYARATVKEALLPFSIGKTLIPGMSPDFLQLPDRGHFDTTLISIRFQVRYRI